MALVYLINDRGGETFPFEPDYSIACLASSIKAAGHDLRVFDSNPLVWDKEKLLESARREKPEIVGFKITSFLNFACSAYLAKEIRKASPASVIVAGGPHPTVCEEAIFEVTDAFDILAVSEGDVTVVELAEYAIGKRALKDVRNIIFKDSGDIVKTGRKIIDDLDELKIPDWSVFDLESYFPIFPVCMQRGCMHHCSFCIADHIWGKVRRRSIKPILEELRFIKDRYGVVSFYLTDPTPDTEYLRSMCDFIITNKLPMQWYSYCHIADFKGLDFADYARAGCKTLLFGIESGDRDILNSIRKGFSPQDVKPVFKRAKDYGIYVMAFFICGFPGETEGSILNSLELIKDVSPDEYEFSIFSLQPGSPVALNPAKFNIELDPDFKKNYSIGYENCWSSRGSAGNLIQISYELMCGDLKKRFSLPNKDLSYNITSLLADLSGMSVEEFYKRWTGVWNFNPDFKGIKDMIDICWVESRRRAREGRVVEKSK